MRALKFIFAVFLLLVFCVTGALTQTDEELWRMIKEAGDSSDYPASDVLYIFDRVDVTVEKTGLAHYRRHRLIKVLTNKGALKEGVMRFDYDPSSNLIEIESIRIFRKDGSIDTVGTGSIKDIYAPAHMIYWGARMKLVQLPRLFDGDAIEIKTYKKGFEIAYLFDDRANLLFSGCGDGESARKSSEEERYIPPMKGHFYDVVLFQGTNPVKEKRYTLHIPLDMHIQFKVYNGPIFSSQRFDSMMFHYEWWLGDVPPVRKEPHMPALSDLVPKLVLATVPSWEAKSKWFASIHDTIFDDNEAIREKVKEITRGLRSDLDKVKALQHWAAQEIRYSGISMGKGEGYTIHPGKMIFHDRCGVCKDKAGMLITLLRSAGFEAYPALTMAGARVEDIPADQFNHCVVAWRHKDGTYTMLDPTWVPYSTELWSSAEQEQYYVIGTPWGEGLKKTPYSPPENHIVKITSNVRVNPDGSMSGRLRLTATNYMDQRLRRYFGTHRKDDMRSFLELCLSNISPWVEVKGFRVADPLDFENQFFVEVEYEVRDFAIAGENTLDFSSPGWSVAFGSRYLFPSSMYVETEKRDWPLFIWFTQTVACDETIILPGKFRASCSEQSKMEGDYISYETSRVAKGRVVKNRGKIFVKRRLIPQDAYGDFRSLMLDARSFVLDRIVARR